MSRQGTPRISVVRADALASPPCNAQPKLGDGGQVSHRLVEAALERRGNAGVRADLQDANRLYDPVAQSGWEKKYKFFSGKHMKDTYRVFARARHDPFNKDPSWGRAVIGRVASACKEKGIQPEGLFRGVDITGDGNLNRAELKKVLISVLPSLSDLEIAALFDTIDTDQSGEVNVAEFCHALSKTGSTRIPKEAAERWRNPLHRMHRFPPATLEGWDHLEAVGGTSRLDELADTAAREVMSRLEPVLRSTPRSIHHAVKTQKYHYFSGGADSGRFTQRTWDRHVPHDDYGPADAEAFPDPGPDLRPGFLCHQGSQLPAVARGFSALTPRTPRRAR